MFGNARDAGLLVRFPSPPRQAVDAGVEITDEAGLTAPRGQELRIGWFAEEGTSVGQGAPIASLRGDQDFALVAPMPAKVARVRMQPGKRLTEIVLYADAGAGRHRHSVAEAVKRENDALRRLLMNAGMWPLFRSRPYGRIPDRGEKPAAIFVMAIDTRPFAADPATALAGKEEAFGRGLDALAVLTDGPIFVCQSAGPPLLRAAQGRGGWKESLPVGAIHRECRGIGSTSGFRRGRMQRSGIAMPKTLPPLEDFSPMGSCPRPALSVSLERA